MHAGSGLVIVSHMLDSAVAVQVIFQHPDLAGGNLAAVAHGAGAVVVDQHLPHVGIFVIQAARTVGGLHLSKVLVALLR